MGGQRERNSVYSAKRRPKTTTSATGIIRRKSRHYSIIYLEEYRLKRMSGRTKPPLIPRLILKFCPPYEDLPRRGLLNLLRRWTREQEREENIIKHIGSLKLYRSLMLLSAAVLTFALIIPMFVMIPHMWNTLRTSNLPLGTAALYMSAIYLSNIIGIYLGIKLYFASAPPPIVSIQLHKRISASSVREHALKAIKADVIKRLSGLTHTIPAGATIFIILFGIAWYIHISPISPFWLKKCLFRSTIAIQINFIISYIWIAPNLYDFLYTDWLNKMLDEVKEEFLQHIYKNKAIYY